MDGPGAPSRGPGRPACFDQSRVSKRRECREYGVGVVSDAGYRERLADHALWIDEVRHPQREGRVLVVRLALDLIQSADRVILVREQSECEALVLRPGQVVADRVEGDPDDVAARGREVADSTAQLSAFDGTAGCTCFRIPP